MFQKSLLTQCLQLISVLGSVTAETKEALVFLVKARFVCQKPPQSAWALSVPVSQLPISGKARQQPSSEKAQLMLPLGHSARSGVWQRGADSRLQLLSCPWALCGQRHWLVRTGDRKLVPSDPGCDIRRECRGPEAFRKVTSQVLSSHPIVIKGQLILCAFQVTRP